MHRSVFDYFKALVGIAVKQGTLPNTTSAGRHHQGVVGHGSSRIHNTSQRERANRRKAKRAAKARRI